MSVLYTTNTESREESEMITAVAANECKEEGCKGEIDFSKPIQVRVGCQAFAASYPCKACGRLHWGTGSPIFDRSNSKAFLLEEKIFVLTKVEGETVNA